MYICKIMNTDPSITHQRFFCTPERADLLNTAVELVNSAAMEPTDPIIELTVSPTARMERMWVGIGYITGEYLGEEPPTPTEAMQPVWDAVRYLEARPEAPDDLGLKQEPTE
jgi:hypothetical protein